MLRTAAWVVLFGGWMVPMGLATFADRGVPGSGSPFRWIAGVWLVLALVYAVVVAVRVRRELME
ncbi:MAG TPA: hypothetical protein VGD77_01060 [Gemmatimonadaceae bacterium]|jgi:hypothetical protein